MTPDEFQLMDLKKQFKEDFKNDVVQTKTGTLFLRCDLQKIWDFLDKEVKKRYFRK